MGKNNQTKAASHLTPHPIRGNQGAPDDGPRNIERDLQNPSLLTPPETDSGTLPNLKFSFSDTHVRLEEGCEFILVFDDGSFSENSTFSLTDWFAHTPKDVLAANFGVSERTFNPIPQHEKYMYQGKIPGPIAKEKPAETNGSVPNPFSFKLMDTKPIKTSGGQVRIADSSNFKAAKTIASALVEVEPGGIRELHWHPNTDEWQYYIEGEGRMTVFAAEGHARTFDYQAGDVGYVPFAMGHYVQNTGDTPLRFLEMFRSDHFADISLNQWMALTPPNFVKEHLHLDDQFIETALHKDKWPNVKF